MVDGCEEPAQGRAGPGSCCAGGVGVGRHVTGTDLDCKPDSGKPLTPTPYGSRQLLSFVSVERLWVSVIYNVNSGWLSLKTEGTKMTADLI